MLAHYVPRPRSYIIMSCVELTSVHPTNHPQPQLVVKQTLTAAQQQSLAERERLEALGLAKPKRTYSQLISEALLNAQNK